MYQHGLKRVLDFLLALCGLLVLWPVFVIIAAAIKIDDPGPVFFSQKRVGLHKRYFWLYKFRSMKVSTPDVPTHLLEHPEQYISKVGGFLRKYSLDELPQMINILLGQMAIIGPRPALWSQEDLIAERDKYGANDVRPGLTGWPSATAGTNDGLRKSLPMTASMSGSSALPLTASASSAPSARCCATTA